MDVKVQLSHLTDGLRKYRHAVLVVIIGLILMAIPGFGKEKGDTKLSQASQLDKDLSVEQRLSEVLSQIHGAGEVTVMLTVTKGEETLYQMNEDISSGNDTKATKVDTVTVTDADRNEKGLIRQTNPPQYLGAVVICSGANDPTVRLSIVDAVSKVTGLGADRISVLKMK